jgi:hypothetical protein
MYQIYLEFTPFTAPFNSHSPIYEIVITVIIVAFTCICTYFLHHIHPPISFPHHLPVWLVPTLPPVFGLLFSDFAGEKR